MDSPQAVGTGVSFTASFSRPLLGHRRLHSVVAHHHANSTTSMLDYEGGHARRDAFMHTTSAFSSCTRPPLPGPALHAASLHPPSGHSRTQSTPHGDKGGTEGSGSSSPMALLPGVRCNGAIPDNMGLHPSPLPHVQQGGGSCPPSSPPEMISPHVAPDQAGSTHRRTQNTSCFDGACVGSAQGFSPGESSAC